MKIYHAEISSRRRWVTDPDLGPVQREERTFGRSNTHRISDGEAVYDADETGTFEVPEKLGKALVRTPGWHEGESPFPPEDDTSKAKPRRPGTPRPT